VPPLSSPHLVEDSVLLCFISIYLLWCINKVFSVIGILEEAFKGFDRVTVLNCILVFWAVIEGKLLGLPFSSPIRHGVYLLMKCADIVIGKVKFIDNLDE
jgi:hypothetical protein